MKWSNLIVYLLRGGSCAHAKVTSCAALRRPSQSFFYTWQKKEWLKKTKKSLDSRLAASSDSIHLPDRLLYLLISLTRLNVLNSKGVWITKLQAVEKIKYKINVFCDATWPPHAFNVSHVTIKVNLLFCSFSLVVHVTLPTNRFFCFGFFFQHERWCKSGKRGFGKCDAVLCQLWVQCRVRRCSASLWQRRAAACSCGTEAEHWAEWVHVNMLKQALTVTPLLYSAFQLYTPSFF